MRTRLVSILALFTFLAACKSGGFGDVDPDAAVADDAVSADAASGATCASSATVGYYCAGQFVPDGEADTLYYCGGPGPAEVQEACAQSCIAVPGADDYCGEVTATCDSTASSGYYCAGNEVSDGVTDTLYSCSGPGPATVHEVCEEGCVSAPDGSDDYCAGTAAAMCDSSASTGYYCAGDHVTGGTTGTLYSCNGPGAATVHEVCASGCTVAPAGSDDYCAEASSATCDSDASTGYYCAGDKVSGGETDTLYFCNGPGAATVHEICTNGCAVAPAGYDDHCATGGATCDSDANTGYYCAGDKVSGGDADTLYYCAGPGPASLEEACSDGCVVAAAGSDDYCAAAGATCDSDASTGYYCAGDKVSGGTNNTLYYCNGPGTATVDEVCANGCVVASAGSDDYCASPGATCDSDASTGYYCAGDKVSGGTNNTLYYCNGPGPATVQQVCSGSCIVAPAGSDDYCQGSGGTGYRLPYACGATYTCSNGNNTTSHSGTDQYAYDFAMSVGTSVRAIRAGVVHAVRIVSTPGSACYNGGGSACANYANTVEVRHSDGTIGLYMHISTASVSKGQSVNQGQEVAKSGNTGWSTGPHLHLQVQSNCGIWWCQSINFSFVEASSLYAGQAVTSQNCP